MTTAVKLCDKPQREHIREAGLKGHVGHPCLLNLQNILIRIILGDLIRTGLPQIQDVDLHLILHILVQNHLKPTQREGSRSNINKPVPFSTSAPPQHKSSPDVGNKNPDGLVTSPLEDKSDFRTTPENEIKNTNNKQEGKGSALNSEVLPDKCANVDGYTGVDFGKSLADYNDNVTSEVRSRNANFDGTSSVKSNQVILGKNGRSKSLKLTTNEVVSALKRYKMETHEVESLDQPVEKYFGAARLWPWEIIYYRRLKKGPISTENYARRLEQNKEFGIVDQYVRSSSGWWEYHYTD
ncbi:hypothetical protein PR202_gb08692 [Eleusine coracana subsp. coracana]|uniref:Uncharacterized protein n=1 Tax=Eleusine coracana subsp. coracana TaxID=191504 RepID=A0AAV5EFI3_ELECO|nr:hypothetical protein PR202_gb08692 [Eleusine coracana subsp. coracana]